MKLFAGLGNVGAGYARNRHNIGFMVVDRIAGDHGFSPWRRKFQGEIAEGRFGGEKAALLKPRTMMNLSGHSVGEAARYLKIAPEDIVVFHDEIDLAPAKCRVKRSGGHAGHNGLRSIHRHLGPDYARVRLGVGHPGDKTKVANYLLRDFSKADRDWVDDLVRGCADGAPRLAAGDDAGFMNAVALRVAPHRPKPAAPRQPAAAPSGQPAPTASPFAKLIGRFGRS